MERGLFWLPLLVFFFWLAYSGWNEYRKVESYRLWAEQFEQAKYDLYAVLGYQKGEISYGKPTRTGPVDLRTISLADIKEIRLLVNDKPIDLDESSIKGKVALEFIFKNKTSSDKIPFTEFSLAKKWLNYLEGQLDVLTKLDNS